MWVLKRGFGVIKVYTRWRCTTTQTSLTCLCILLEYMSLFLNLNLNKFPKQSRTTTLCFITSVCYIVKIIKTHEHPVHSPSLYFNWTQMKVMSLKLNICTNWMYTTFPQLCTLLHFLWLIRSFDYYFDDFLYCILLSVLWKCKYTHFAVKE